MEDFRRNGREIAVVSYHGVRRHDATYAELATLAGRLAAELERRGINSGDRVVLWGENSAAWVAAFFGCLLRGVLAVPLDAAGSPEFAARVIADVSPKLILADTPRLTKLPAEAQRLSLDDLGADLPPQPVFNVDPSVNLDAPFQIVFTSGTTSDPKGIVHTHRNVLASLDPIEREIAKYRRYEWPFHPLRFLHSLPLSHVFGQFMGLWIPAVLSAEVHFENQLEPARMIDRIHFNRISVLVAVPRSLELLRSHVLLRFPGLDAQIAASAGLSIPKRMWRFRRVHRLTGWKFWALISGGATLPPELELFWGRLGYAVIQGYGMTETAALITLNHPFHVGRGTLGKTLPGREIRISPEGEIMVRGDVVSGSTWKNGKIEQRKEEWLATGDLATQDASGELRFSGRRGDVIVTAAGLNLYPADLEAELLKQPGVRAASVVGCEGPNGSEPVAVLLFDGGDERMQQALEQANQSLANSQQMRRVLRWPDPSFPFTTTGKLLRRTIASWACEQLAATAGQPAKSRGDALLDMIASVTGESPSKTDDAARLTEDLHLDSLGRVQLQSLLEQQFGLELADEQVAQIAKLGDLRALVGSRAKATAAGVTGSQQATTNQGQTPSTEAGDQTANEGQTLSAEAQAPSTGLATNSAPAAPAPLKREHRYLLWPLWGAVNWLRVAFQEVIGRPLVRFLAAPLVEVLRAPPNPSIPGAVPALLPAALPARSAPMLIIANHVTAYDMPLVLYGLPPALRHRIAVAMSGEMLLDFRSRHGAPNAFLNLLMPIAYWLITILFNVFPLPRLGGFRRSFEHAGRALDRGYSVLVFPEGRRSQDGTLQPFRSGIGLLAQQAETAVLPVGLIGLGQVKRNGGRWFRSGRLIVRVGEPIPYDAQSAPEQTTQRLQAAMTKLLAKPDSQSK